MQAVWTPLQLAIRRNLTTVSLVLAKAGGNFTQLNPDGLTPLTSAVFHRNIDLVHGFIQLGANANQGVSPQDTYRPKCRYPTSPFLNACEKGHLPLIDTMLRLQISQGQQAYIEHAVVNQLWNSSPERSRNPRVLDFLLRHSQCHIEPLFHICRAQHVRALPPMELAVLLRAGASTVLRSRTRSCTRSYKRNSEERKTMASIRPLSNNAYVYA